MNENLKIALSSYRIAAEQLDMEIDEAFPFRCVVKGNYPSERFTIGMAVRSDHCPHDGVPILTESGSTLFFPPESVERIDDESQWPQWIVHKKQKWQDNADYVAKIIKSAIDRDGSPAPDVE